jgi:predicted anti-sigma-YlaC factor YlaD
MFGSEAIQHLNEDTLELIALNRLPEPNLAAAEEHLLVCEKCRRALTEADEYVAAMRTGLN